jgi:hypothetical protein
MSLEMAHKVIVPQKKIWSQSFLNSGTLIVIFGDNNFLSHFLGHFEGASTFLTPKLSLAALGTI